MSDSKKEKIQRHLRRLGNIKFAIGAYFTVSLLLSVSIFLRLSFAPDNLVKDANFVLYFLTYTGASAVSALYILHVFRSLKNQPNKFERRLGWSFAFLVCYSLILFPLSSLGFVPEYIALVIPVFIAYAAYVITKKLAGTLSKKVVAAATLILILSPLIPICTALVLENQVLDQAKNAVVPNAQVQVVGSFVQKLYTFNVYRSYADFLKYLLVGTGACQESAMAATTLLKNMGYEARIVVLPGEDHAFTEVKINDTWMVIDTGYGVTSPISREQRAKMRTDEMGAISFVITYSGSNFTELTSLYVPTDTITIKVTSGSAPLANAQVYLLHEFMSATKQLPDTGASFYTSTKGEITFHLGALTYNEKASKYDKCYWIYVNGKSTGYNVTSTGTGVTWLVEITL